MLRPPMQPSGGPPRPAPPTRATPPPPGGAGPRPPPPPAIKITLADIEEALQHRAALYDRAGDWHYDIASAFIKSLRGSDPDAALYWLAPLLEGGGDPPVVRPRPR